MKLKTLIQTLLFSSVRRLVRSLSAAKSKAVSALVHSQTLQLICTTKKNRNRNNIITKYNKKNNKIFFGSFRLHYNWCSSKSSHVLPVPAPVYDGLPETTTATHFYYDSTWNSVIPTGQYGAEIDQYGGPESQLYGYLQWLEEKQMVLDKNGDTAAGDHDHDHDGDADGDQPVEVDDIDKLADLFIASCHAKFILEKQESARRFKEMLERSA